MIVKTFRISEAEEQVLIAMMEKSGDKSLSSFIRRRIFQTRDRWFDWEELATQLHKINQANQLEKINERLYRIQVLAQEAKQVDAYKMDQVMACFRDLLHEAERTLPLSEEFKEKWL